MDKLIISRRDFLKLSIGAGVATLAPSFDVITGSPYLVAAVAYAATRVNPQLLMMTGIESSGDSIEAGYHLRWFCGPDLEHPKQAFPGDPHHVAQFVTTDSLDRLQFSHETPTPPTTASLSGKLENAQGEPIPRARILLIPEGARAPLLISISEADGSFNIEGIPPGRYTIRIIKSGILLGVTGSIDLRIGSSDRFAEDTLRAGDSDLVDLIPTIPPPGPGPGETPGPYNPGVPTAFDLYRRVHFPHFDHSLEVSDRILEDLRRSGEPVLVAPGVVLTYSRTGSRETVIVNFRHPDGTGRRTVHFIDLRLQTRSSAPPPRMRVHAFADGDPEPVRSISVRWRGRGVFPPDWEASVRLVQGHYDELRISSQRLPPFRLRYSYMDEDTQLADDPENPGPGEWVHIRSVLFITYFQTWQAAKAEFFRHPLKNRYLDFSGPGVQDTWDFKLDYKYSPLFKRLQQTFVRLQHAKNRNATFLNWSGGNSLTEIRGKPYFFYQLWCMDPIIATLLSQYYSDVPGPHNPRPPDLGSTYDYMVTAAWQEPENRLCYISQKVSLGTTPPVLPFKDLSGSQLEGVSRAGDQTLYRAGLNWKVESAESPYYGFFEPPLADIRRGDSPDPGQMNLITHYVEPGAAPGEQVVDVPVHVPVSITYPTTEKDRSKFTPRQLNALDLQRTLQARDARAAITADQIDAYREMVRTSTHQFFDVPEPQNRFNEWLPVGATGERTDYYDVRPVDLFGRVGPWHGPTAVTLKANLPAPEPVNVRAFLKRNGSQPDSMVVSWRLDTRQLYTGAPVNHFNILWKLYDPNDIGRPRPFHQWQNQMLSSAIPYQSPTDLSVWVEQPLEGASIAGQILDATASSASEKVAEEMRLLGPNTRIIMLTTDQTFLGLPPFVDISSRYANASGLLDSIKLHVNDSEWDVIAFADGDTLQLGIPVTVTTDGTSPAESFLSSLGSSRAFTLKFESIKESFDWSQTLDRSHFPEIPTDPQLSEVSSYTVALAERLANRRTLQLRISDPFNLDITGRELWLTSGATLEYNSGIPRRIPITDFGIIEISADALRFGSVWTGREDPPTQTVTIANGGSTDLLVNDATANNSAFSVQLPASSERTIAPGSSLAIEVTFKPSAPEAVNAALTVTTDVGSIDIALSGAGVAAQDDDGADLQLPMSRRFLADLTLSQVVLEADANENVENPALIFPETLLRTALDEDPSNLACRIRIPPIRRIVTNQLATGGTQLDNSPGGALTFIPAEAEDEEIICEVLTRPASVPGDNERISFLIRQAHSPPNAPIGPTSNQDCTFYPVYREEISLPPELLPTDTAKRVNIALSTHRNPPDEGYNAPADRDNPVSATVEVKIPAAPPPELKVTRLEIKKDPWIDPFNVDYTRLPKLLDNRKAVQYRLRLDDECLMRDPASECPSGNASDFEPPEVPTNGALEIFRAPEDGLRTLVLDHVKLPVPQNWQADDDFQDFVDFLPDTLLPDDRDCRLSTFVTLPPVKRYRCAFDVFNQMTEAERYQALTTRLINFWDHSQYSLKGAFRPIGKIDDPNRLYLIDELEGTAAGNLFYAIRSIRQGAEPSELKLLPFRVAIPNIAAPAAPEAALRIYERPYYGGVPQGRRMWTDTRCFAHRQR